MVSEDGNAAARQMNLQRFVNFCGWCLSDGLLSENARLADLFVPSFIYGRWHHCRHHPSAKRKAVW